MRIESITAANFKSFAAEQTLVLPAAPGLYFMQGVNEAEPRLEANGAGKSTLWDAACWCLFGRTATGLKAGDVCNWAAGKGARVSVVLVDDDRGIEQTVTRTWGPISWRLRTRDVSGSGGGFDEVEDVDPKAGLPADVVGLDCSPFLYAVLMAQDQPMFLDQKSEAQAALFSEVMGLDRWVGYSAEAGRRAAEQDAATRRLERELAAAEARLDATARQDFAAADRRWRDERKAELDALADEYAALLGRRRELKARSAGLDEDELNARALLRARQGEAEAPARELAAARYDLSDYSGLLASLERDAEKAEGEAGHLADKRTTECPTCGHTMARGEAENAARAARRRADKASAAVKATKASVDRLRARVAEAERQAEGVLGAEREAADGLEGAKQAAGSARRELQFADRDLDAMEDRAERLTAEASPYAGLERSRAKDAERARADAARLRAAADDSERRQSILAYWVRGFKEVRLRQIADALAELEIEVNSCCASLGLVGWELGFAVDRETKGGGVSRGFSVSVRSPGSARAVPWDAWSGGEKQRLRLAGNMGLADLVRARTGCALGLEVWDEPTKNLSAAGVSDLLDTLEARARHEGRQVWIVDHRTHSFGGFAGGATVVKTAAGSVVRQ